MSRPTVVAVLRADAATAELRGTRPAPAEGLVQLGRFAGPTHLADLGPRLDHPQLRKSVFVWALLRRAATACPITPQQVEVWVPVRQRNDWTVHGLPLREVPCA